MLGSMNKSRILGVDYGKRRVGLALSSEDGVFAFPLTVLENNAQLIQEVVRSMSAEGVSMMVVGESRTFSGEENSINARAQAFAEEVKKETNCTVVFEDETLTTQHARRAHEQKEKTRKPQRGEVVDASAAALILQSYLDKNKI